MIRDRSQHRLSAALAGALALALLTSTARGQVVQSQQKLSRLAGGFPAGALDAGDQLGTSLASIGDLDGDGVIDLAAGAIGDDDGDVTSFLFGRGAVWILFLQTDGTLKSTQKISATQGGFSGTLDLFDDFGTSVAALGDLDGDGTADIAVGAGGDDDGGSNRGAVYVLFLNPDGTVKAQQKIAVGSGGFTGTLADEDRFGASLGAPGDVDGDGVFDLVVGATGTDDGAADAGAVWVLFLNPDGTVKAQQEISATSGGFVGTLDAGDAFGFSVAGIGDLDLDSVADLVVGAIGDDDGGTDRGAAWVLFLNANGTLKNGAKIGSNELSGLSDGDEFGSAASLVDLDGDGTNEVAIGARRDDDGGASNFSDRGAVWVLSLNTDGTVASAGKISATAGGFTGVLDDNDLFGAALASLGKLDAGVPGDLAVGAPLDDDGGGASGAIWNLFGGLAASSAVRNGSGVNPLGFAEVSPAVIGQSWDTTVDIATPGAVASVVIIALGGPSSGTILSGFFSGEILCLPPFLPADIAAGSHSFPVPPDTGLVGLNFCAQAATFNPMDVRLQNALDVTVGSQ